MSSASSTLIRMGAVCGMILFIGCAVLGFIHCSITEVNQRKNNMTSITSFAVIGGRYTQNYLTSISSFAVIRGRHIQE